MPVEETSDGAVGEGGEVVEWLNERNRCNDQDQELIFLDLARRRIRHRKTKKEAEAPLSNSVCDDHFTLSTMALKAAASL